MIHSNKDFCYIIRSLFYYNGNRKTKVENAQLFNRFIGLYKEEGEWYRFDKE